MPKPYEGHSCAVIVVIGVKPCRFGRFSQSFDADRRVALFVSDTIWIIWRNGCEIRICRTVVPAIVSCHSPKQCNCFSVRRTRPASATSVPNWPSFKYDRSLCDVLSDLTTPFRWPNCWVCTSRWMISMIKWHRHWSNAFRICWNSNAWVPPPIPNGPSTNSRKILIFHLHSPWFIRTFHRRFLWINWTFLMNFILIFFRLFNRLSLRSLFPRTHAQVFFILSRSLLFVLVLPFILFRFRPTMILFFSSHSITIKTQPQ